MDISVLRGSSAAVADSSVLGSQVLESSLPDDLKKVITSYLRTDDVARYTATCRAFREEPLRQEQAIDPSVARGLPEHIERIRSAARAIGPINIISTSDSGTGYLYPHLHEMRSSISFLRDHTHRQRGIVLLVRGNSEGYIDIPFSSIEGTYRREIKNISSTIFLMERYTTPDGWYLMPDPAYKNEIAALDPSLVTASSPLTSVSDEIVDTIVSIINGLHPSIRLCSIDSYSTKFKPSIDCQFQYTVPEGYSLVVQDSDGKEYEIDKEEETRFSRYEDNPWGCFYRIQKSLEYKIYLRAPDGALIPEDGPMRSSTFTSPYPIKCNTRNPVFTLPPS